MVRCLCENSSLFSSFLITIRCATTADYDQDGKWGNCVGVKCFKIIEEEKEYFEARSICTNDQATLATVNNEYEQGLEYFSSFISCLILNNYLAFLTASLRNRPFNAYYIGGL